ncbi:uracil-DNA glycosylase [Allochromatium tepidum]|uniref:Type-4 uracil-DNA glycosylase n=1 Tax=Allochromatium tepidum TaxID=553982 RepID=A0ABN6GB62_9GAMM|nr:uracil-DNA glycosylase [Allochromatium tepidum]BCU07181.1 hypothetical protein Atep_18580 [Allochromatium tepidum]
MSETRAPVERPPLDEGRRLAYLEAMGVSVWELRAPPVTMPEAITAMPVPVERTESVESIPDLEPLPFTDLDESVEYSPALLDECDAMGHPPAFEAEAVNPIERMDWDALDAAVRGCRACRLWETRTKTVFGVGDRRADLMIIGEAPGADEDSQGEPFVGRAGQLLNRMLAAIGFSREQVYIANVLKCRPPGNRDPKPDEALACQAYLHRQVALIEPKVILSVGRISAQHLLKTDTPVGQLRGRWFDYGPARIPLRVTYHPAYLLRSPEQKAKAWEDLTEVRRRL